MSTDTPTSAAGHTLPTFPRPSPSDRLLHWRSCVGDTLDLVLASRRVRARLAGVDLDCSTARPRIQLRVETTTGSLTVSPAMVDSSRDPR